MMDTIGALSGSVRVELTSADITAALGNLTNMGIMVFDTEQKGDLTTSFTIHRKNMKKVTEICEKRGDTLKVLGRSGLYWAILSVLRRPVLVVGLILLLLGVSYLPSRVFFVEVEGNENVPSRLILAAAEDCGIRFGASRREVRSEKIKNALLEAVPSLQWAGVNTYGCVARISVRERAPAEETAPGGSYGSIVALRDGVITSCTATKGNLICGVGQAVKKGEVLISGYTDCGLCIRSEQAEGEVYARTRRQMTAVMPSDFIKRVTQTEEKQKFSLLIGKNRINLWKDSRISDTTCGKMYKEYYMTLPGGFRLPVALIVETYSMWLCEAASFPQPEAEAFLASQSQQLLHSQMVAGSIHSEDTSVWLDSGVYTFEGEYVCIEMIGSMQRQQIGEVNEQTG